MFTSIMIIVFTGQISDNFLLFCTRALSIFSFFYVQCIMYSVHSSSQIGRKTVGPVSCRVGVGDVNFPCTRLLCGGCPPLGWDGWKRHL